MLRIFSKDRRILSSDVDTWIVNWTTYTCSFTGRINYPNVKECYQAFTNKQEAEDFAQALNECKKMLGITALPSATVYKQERAGL